jgi:hypothetical protein
MLLADKDRQDRDCNSDDELSSQEEVQIKLNIDHASDL